MIEITDGKPMPPYRKRGARTVYRWNEMQIGQCFKFPEHVALNDARRMAYEAGRVLCMRFAVRMQENHEVWCWRVEDDYGETRNPNKPVTIEFEDRAYEARGGDKITGYGTPHPDRPDGTDDPI